MNVARAATALVGVALATFGLAVIASPSLASGLPVEVVGVSLLVILTFGQAARVFVGWTRRDHNHRTVEPSEAEAVQAGPTPGEAFDRLLAQVAVSSDPGSQRTQRDRIQWRLREAVISALQCRGYDTAEAVSMITDGSWTDNEVARGVFSDEEGGGELRAEGGIRGFLGLTTSPRESFVRSAEQACDEVAALAGVDRDTRPHVEAGAGHSTGGGGSAGGHRADDRQENDDGRRDEHHEPAATESEGRMVQGEENR